MDGQYRKGDRTMSTNEWLLTSDFWQFLEPWHGRWYEYEFFIASWTDNIYDLVNERWLLGDMIDHVGIYGSRVAEGLSAFNIGLVTLCHSVSWLVSSKSTVQIPRHINHLKIHRFQGIISRRNNYKVKVDAVFSTIPILVPSWCQFYVIFCNWNSMCTTKPIFVG